MPEIVYKWVAVEDGRRFSALVGEGPARVEYKPDEWACPPGWLARRGYGLCVFRTVADAEEFRAVALELKDAEFELWEAEAEGVAEPSGPPVYVGWLEQGLFRPTPYTRWYHGTLWAMQVRLVRVVERAERRKDWREILDEEGDG